MFIPDKPIQISYLSTASMRVRQTDIAVIEISDLVGVEAADVTRDCARLRVTPVAVLAAVQASVIVLPDVDDEARALFERL